MRGFLHVLATIVLVPYMVLAIAFLLLGHIVSSGSILAALDALLTQAVWLVPWGIIGFVVGIVLLAIFGAMPSTRLPAAICLTILGVGAMLVLLVMTSSPVDADALLFLLPCALALAGSAWIVRAERQARARSPDQARSS